ncbi:hypothetical protein [Acinetobacter stercoris]|uniref:Uncharacterized protein n=1 Tax=Acinetobacter stercoris TaxID=2126983 RepID=A0A2U3N245_9GAMM|nr:hypothetical protein [Acinetobacter stercoris]SPL71766.1 hypothetical protein KPC_2944 [Acinetobacter stercoris]
MTVTINQLKSMDVVRDKYGFWLHPVFDEYVKNVIGNAEFLTSGQMQEIRRYFNIRLNTTLLEDDANQEIIDRYFDGDTEACAEWIPTPPGDGYFLISINDSDYGAIAWWAKTKEGI